MMKLITKRLAGTVAALLCTSAFSLNANAYDNVYIFGDSLSDTGNAATFAAAQGITGIPERFSNGPVAVDFIAGALGFQATPSLFLAGHGELGNNYAVGGAIAIDADQDESTPDTNLPTQVNAFLANNNFYANPNNLYIVAIGGNDLFAAQQIRSEVYTEESSESRKSYRQAARERVDQAIESLEAQLQKLIAAGATQFVIGNAPDVSLVPASLDTAEALAASAESRDQERQAAKFLPATASLVDRYNRKLARLIDKLERSNAINVIEWDMQSFLENQIDDADVLGYTNTTDGCIEDMSNLPDCEGYIFFDSVHPTTAIHAATSAEVLEQLLEQ